MPFELDTTLDPALAPLAWLVGTWEGAGVLGYPGHESRNFGQRIEVTHDERPYLRWEAQEWLLDEAGALVKPLARESGYWRVLADGEIELLLAHPTGFLEMYAGRRDSARPVVHLRTDGVMRSPAAKDYSAATRMYGYVEGQLFWAMDMAAFGHPLQSHASAQLKRIG